MLVSRDSGKGLGRAVPIAPCKANIASRQSKLFVGVFPRPVAADEGQSITTVRYVTYSVE